MTSPTTAAPNRLLIALIAVGGALLLAVVAMVFLLIGQNSAPNNNDAKAPQPTPTVTESLTPVEEDAEEPTTNDAPPPDNSVRFTSFNADLTVECDTTGQAEEKAQPQISWSSANAVHVYWTPNSNDADASNGYEVGASGNQNDMSASKGEGERYEFPCNHRETFDTTITLVGANGEKVSKHVTFTDVNWNSGGDDSDD